MATVVEKSNVFTQKMYNYIQETKIVNDELFNINCDFELLCKPDKEFLNA